MTKFSGPVPYADELAGRLVAYGEFAELDGRASDLGGSDRALLRRAVIDRRSACLDGARDAGAEQILRCAGYPAVGEQPTRIGRLRSALRPFRRAQA